MTKEIELTQGKVALVDDEDYEELSKYKWHAQRIYHSDSLWYARREGSVDGKRIVNLMHRQLLGLVASDGMIVDHINKNSLDNRRCNLRIVSYAENSQNHNVFITNTSGHTGVWWRNKNKVWSAEIRAYGTKHCLGCYDDINNAIEARRQGEG